MAIRLDPRNIERAMAARAEWLATVAVPQAFPSGETFHPRGLHYAIKDLGLSWPCFGSKYATTPTMRKYGVGKTAKDRAYQFSYLVLALSAARWMGLIPWERVMDERSQTPEVILPNGERWEPYAEDWFTLPRVEIPAYRDIAFRFDEGFSTAPQKFKLMMWSEKASVRNILASVARDFDAELWMHGAGDISNTHIYEMARRIRDDGRKAIIFTFCDCDPGGWNMPSILAYKLACMTESVGEFSFAVQPVATLPAQVFEHGLPQCDLSDGEKRAKLWRQRFNMDAAEIDALVSRPDLLREIAVDAISPFYDSTLWDRTREVRGEALASLPDIEAVDEGLVESVRQTISEIEDLVAELNDLGAELPDPKRHEFDIDQPQPELGDLPDCEFDFDRDGIDGTQAKQAAWTNHGVEA